MDNQTFHLRLAQWTAMPGDIEEKAYFMRAYPDPLDTKFHALSALYLEGNPQQQTQLKHFFASDECSITPLLSLYARFDNAVIYMRRVSRSMRTATDGALLRQGLAAAAYTDGHVDPHDLLVSLAFLYSAATRVGLDPVPTFNDVAATAGLQAREALRSFISCDASTPQRIVQHYEGTC